MQQGFQPQQYYAQPQPHMGGAASSEQQHQVQAEDLAVNGNAVDGRDESVLGSFKAAMDQNSQSKLFQPIT